MPPNQTARMRAVAALARAELLLARAVRTAMTAFLHRLRTAVLPRDGLPDLNVWPGPDHWRGLARAYVVPAAEDVFLYGFGASLGQPAAAPQVRHVLEYLAGVPDRLSGWPVRVFRQVKKELAEAITAGEGVPAMRDRIAAVLEPEPAARWRWDHDAVRIARTEAVAAYNGGAQAAAEQALLEGRAGGMVKEWLATADDRTRDTHRAADGQTRPIGQPFLVGGFPLMFPGDPAAPPAETVQCRCTQLIVPEGG